MGTLRVLLAAALTCVAVFALPSVASAGGTGFPWELKNPVGPQQVMREGLRAVCALDGGTAWVAGAQNALYFSHDGGRSWERQATGAPQQTVWRAVRFADRKHGYLTGAAGGSGVVYATADGGRSWTRRTAVAGVALTDLDLDGAGRVWAVGDGGAVLASADGGTTWRRSSAGVALAAVDFTDSARGVAVGPRGVIVRSTDGGSTWRRSLALTLCDLNDVAMQSATQGFAVGAQGLVLRTTDGGLTWWRQTTPQGVGDCLAVAFASARRGWIALSSGRLLGTTDGGATWRLEQAPAGSALRALDAPPVADAGPAWGSGARTSDPRTSSAPAPYRAFAAGDGGTVVKYTELGTESRTNDLWLMPETAQGGPMALPSGMAFELDSIQYTTGQPYDGWSTGTGTYFNVPENTDYPYFVITILAGRSDSTPVAQWFTDYCGGAEIGIGTSTATPAKLNFAFNGTLTAGGACTLAFGQGSNSDENNWWVGGPGFTIVTPMGQSTPTVATPGSAWRFIANDVPGNIYQYTFVMTQD